MGGGADLWRFVRAAFQLKGQQLRCERLAVALSSIQDTVGGVEVGRQLLLVWVFLLLAFSL